jgi:hypothetical protein
MRIGIGPEYRFVAAPHSDQIDGADVGATFAVDDYAAEAIMLFAPIR